MICSEGHYHNRIYFHIKDKGEKGVKEKYVGFIVKPKLFSSMIQIRHLIVVDNFFVGYIRYLPLYFCIYIVPT